MYTVIEKTLNRSDNLSTDISFTVVFECVLTITSIFPNKLLLDQASKSISKFLNPSTSNPNLIYLGLIGLKFLTELDQKYIEEHQVFVLECLSSNDNSIIRITMELLTNNINGSNIKLILPAPISLKCI